MEDTLSLPTEFMRVMGPEALYNQLKECALFAKQNSAYASSEHYILYQLGMQKSLIKLDFSHDPLQIWYCDLQNRPVTNKVKEAVLRFIQEQEKGADLKSYFHDHYDTVKVAKSEATEGLRPFPYFDQTIKFEDSLPNKNPEFGMGIPALKKAYQVLSEKKRSSVETASVILPKKTNGWGWSGLFSRKNKMANVENNQVAPKPKIPQKK